MFKVMIPNITREYDGTIIYRWSSGITGYSYKYFIQEHHLELLTALRVMLACGLILLLRKPIRTFLQTQIAFITKIHRKKKA